MIKIFKGASISILENDEKIEIFHKNSKKKIVLEKYYNSGCWECHSHSLDKDGYPKLKLNKKTYRMNRFMFCLFKGINWEDIQGKLLRHTCDNRLCVNPNHLVPGTHEENMIDMCSRDRTFKPIGSLNNMSKLKEDDVDYIRKSNMDNEYLANLFCVKPDTIRKIRNGERWKHVS